MRVKDIERGWKALVIRGIAALMPRAPRGGQPAWDTRRQRVLYLRYDRIGDMILASSIIRAIATTHPSITVDVLASPRNAPVLEGDPHVGSVLIFDRKRPRTFLRTLRALRRARYDAVLDCMVEAPSTTTLLLMLASGARHRIGVGGRSNDFAYTIPVQPLSATSHYVERTAALATPFGIDPASTDWRPRLYLSDTERADGELAWRAHDPGAGEARQARRLLVNISAGKAACTWPDDRFIAVLRHVRARAPELSMLLIGAPAEADRIARIGRDTGIPVAHTPGIRHALALVATADCVFTPDTSIVHAASAFAKPAVVMFPKRSNELYGLYRTAGRHVVGTDRTLDSLRVEPVIDALEELLGLDVVAGDADADAGSRRPRVHPDGAGRGTDPYRPDSPLAG